MKVLKFTLMALIAAVPLWSRSYEYKVTVVFEQTKNIEFAAVKVNNNGQIVGYLWELGPNRNRAATWSRGVFQILEDIGYDAFGQGINDLGIACGFANDATGRPRAVTWYPDGSVRILDLRTIGYAVDITEDGAVFGGWLNKLRYQPFLWTNGNAFQLPVKFPDQESRMRAMGEDRTATGDQHNQQGYITSQWIWYAGSTKVVELPELSWLEGNIDANGVTCGYMWVNGRFYAATYDHGKIARVMEADTKATGLNDFGELVGVDLATDEGLIWLDVTKPGKRLTDLIDPKVGVMITLTKAVNNAGQILAAARSFDRKRNFVVLLEPTKATKRGAKVAPDRFWKVDP